MLGGSELLAGPDGEAAAKDEPPLLDRMLSSAVTVAVVVTVGSFFAAQPLIDLVRHAVSQLPL